MAILFLAFLKLITLKPCQNRIGFSGTVPFSKIAVVAAYDLSYSFRALF